MSPVFAQLPRLLDGFDDLALWQVGASDGVRASLRAVEGLEGQALCLDFDFSGVAGYASARRALAIDFPPNYEFSFYVRGEAPVNNLEFKLIDASGDNVWWVNRRDFVFPHEWQQVKIKKRHIEFAWGPTPRSHAQAQRGARARDQSRKRLVAEARCVSTSSAGTSCRRRRRATPPPCCKRPRLNRARKPFYALDGALSTAWKSHPAAGAEQMLTVDFQSNPASLEAWCCIGSITPLPLVTTWSSPMTAATGEPCVR